MAEKVKRRRIELYCAILAFLGVSTFLLVGLKVYHGLQHRQYLRQQVIHASSFALEILERIDPQEGNLQLAAEAAFEELGYVPELLKRFSVGSKPSSTKQPLGRITAGKWHFDHSPLTVDFSQCYKKGGAPVAETFQPCFVANRDPKQRISAISVELFEPSGGIHHAIAALTPIKVLVLMNLAQSITGTSHSHVDAPYSYEPDNWGACPTTNPVSIEEVAPLQRGMFAGMRSSPGDYECNISRYWSPVFKSKIRRAFLLEKLKVPQPLNDILTSVNFLMGSLEQDGISGDRFGLLTFDNEIIPRRGTAKQEILGLVPPSSLDDEFRDFLQATRPFDDNGLRIQENYKQFVARLLFPRFFSDVIVGGLGGAADERRRLLAGTNYPGGFAEAIAMWAREKSSQWSQNTLLFITDGIGDCTNTHDCNISNRNRYLSITRAVESSLPALLKSHVKVNTMLYGRAAAPHSRLIRSASSGADCLNRMDCCLSESEDVSYGNLVDSTPLVNPKAIVADDLPAGPATTFPNIWQKLSQATGGLWQPLRPPCSKFAAEGFSSEEIRRALQEVCAGLAPLEGLEPGQYRSVFSRVFGSNFSRAVGNEGELFCDAESRSFKRQIVDAVKQGVLGGRKVALVRAESRV
jgi:hypothetical protein